MKKIVVFLLLTAFVSSLYAQSNNCSQNISSQKFNQLYLQIKSKQDDNSRLQLARQISGSYCFSSTQVKEIALLFENDKTRLKFAKTAYRNTTDKQNFYDVYDAFIYYSAVFRLHDFINTKNEQTDYNDGTVTESETPRFSNYNYPSYQQYRGTRNCTSPISDNSFKYIVDQLYQVNNDRNKYVNAINLIRSNCLPTASLMKIASLFSTEEYKLKFALEAVNSVYDIDQYVEMKQIFNTPSGRSKFMESFGNQRSTTTNICKVNPTEYKNIITTLKNEKFNTNKVSSAKQMIQTKKCFTAQQIKGIVELFSYENSRLEIARFGYDYTINQSNYYSTVSQALDFENSKKNLLNYINTKTR